MTGAGVIRKIRPAWKSAGVEAGAILSLPSSLLEEWGAGVGDSLSISIDGDKIILKKIREE